jgi:hypothetical protein
VTFYDGGTALAACTTVAQNASGRWTCTLNSATAPLSLGSPSIVADCGGNTNFAGSINSAPFTEAVADFSIAPSSAATTVVAGSSIQLDFTVSPVNPSTIFPAAITLVPNGLPAGATYTIAPSNTVASCASSCSTTATLTIHTTLTASAKQPGAGGNPAGRLAPLSLALLLLPFAGWVRKAGQRFSRMLLILLLLAAGAAAVAGMSGCNSGGFFAHPQKDYSVTVTGTSGTLTHNSSAVNLTVE